MAVGPRPAPAVRRVIQPAVSTRIDGVNMRAACQKWLVYVAALTITGSFAPAASAQSLVGTVTGKVLEVGGDPIAAATVVISGTQSGALTRADGSYRIALRPGRYEIRARLVGYALGRDSITITAGETVTRMYAREGGNHAQCHRGGGFEDGRANGAECTRSDRRAHGV